MERIEHVFYEGRVTIFIVPHFHKYLPLYEIAKNRNPKNFPRIFPKS